MTSELDRASTPASRVATDPRETAPDVGEGHDFDPVTWTCRRCTVHATQGIAICYPHPDQASTDLRCRCVWRGERCTNRATQEDGLCNWCGNGRAPDQMRDDPKALIGPDGEFYGIGGAGQLHDYDESKPASTAACWYPDADRVVLDV